MGLYPYADRFPVVRHFPQQGRPRADILAEISKPFDKEDRLTQLLVRQREINASLDLDKGNAGAMEAETEAA